MKISRTVPLGGRRGPTGAQTACGDAVACPRGPNITCAQIWDSQATRRMTTCSELRWKTHFFPGENRHAQKITYFLVLL